ncbi:tandem-95 repeat protein, partial [Neptunomonas marina]
NYNGPDSFQYTIADAAGNVSNAATVNLTVTPDNDPPVAVDDSGSTAEDTAVTLDLAGNDNDVDDGLDLTSIVITQQPDHGTLVVNSNGTVTYTPTSGYTGPDSFKYTIADVGGNVSNEATVSLNVVDTNNSVVANDDGGSSNGFVYVGANGGSWTAQGVTVEAFNADGSAGTIVRHSSFGFGVAGTPDSDDDRQNPPQLEYDTATNTSESLVFTYDDFVTSAEVDIARLYGTESVNGQVHTEQGGWIAYVVDDAGNQRVVASDEFSFGSSSNGGTITITAPAGYVFNRIEFVATEYRDGRDTTGSGDASDYFVQGVSATTVSSGFQAAEGDDLTLSVNDLLANDSDPEGDAFSFAGIVDVNGQLVTTGSAVVDANGATVTISGSTLTYNSGNQGLNVGEVGNVDFTYRIEDANGATDDADVSLTVVGTQGTPGSVNIDGTSGNDILDGTGGVDTFVWLDGESGTDTINNFTIGGPGVGDRLDLSDLLVGEESNPLSDYLSVSTNGTDTTIEIRPQGSGGSVEQTIVLDDVTGVTLQDLVNNDQIITD